MPQQSVSMQGAARTQLEQGSNWGESTQKSFCFYVILAFETFSKML